MAYSFRERTHAGEIVIARSWMTFRVVACYGGYIPVWSGYVPKSITSCSTSQNYTQLAKGNHYIPDDNYGLIKCHTSKVRSFKRNRSSSPGEAEMAVLSLTFF